MLHGRSEPIGERIAIDVLIIGGGIQGLWLLNRLSAQGYSTLLLEHRELGGEQTCHSHAYIHQGHLYREGQTGLVERLREVNDTWQQWIEAHAPEGGFVPSYFGYQNPADADQKQALWEQLGLRYEIAYSLPAALAGTSIKRLLKTPEKCLLASSIVDRLRSGLENAISRVRRVERIVIHNSVPAGSVEQIEVIMPNDARLVFFPRALVLAAGAGNQALLELAAGKQGSLVDRIKDAQQIRKANMLVVKGDRACLEPLTGIFPDLRGLFIVSRELPNEIVWLVSDDRSPMLASGADSVYDQRSWLQQVLLALQRLAPRYFADEDCRQCLKWGIYEAPKAEGSASGHVPHEARIEDFGLSNLWTIWPTKLTLAPQAALRASREIDKVLGGPRNHAALGLWRDLRGSPDTAPERWRCTPLACWAEFRDKFSVDYV